MKKTVLSFLFLFCLLVSFAQNSYTIEDFQATVQGENTTYVLKPEHDVNEFSLEIDVAIVSEEGSFSLAWNFCDSGDCNIFHCFPNAFMDIIGNTPLVMLKKKEVNLNFIVKVASDHELYYQLFMDNQLKSEGYKVIERDFSRKLYLRLTTTGGGFKINPS